MGDWQHIAIVSFIHCGAIISTPVLMLPSSATFACPTVSLAHFLCVSACLIMTQGWGPAAGGIRQSNKLKWVNRLAYHFRRHLSVHWPHCSICVLLFLLTRSNVWFSCLGENNTSSNLLNVTDLQTYMAWYSGKYLQIDVVHLFCLEQHYLTETLALTLSIPLTSFCILNYKLLFTSY